MCTLQPSGPILQVYYIVRFNIYFYVANWVVNARALRLFVWQFSSGCFVIVLDGCYSGYNVDAFFGDARAQPKNDKANNILCAWYPRRYRNVLIESAY
jgi:hypothetical protein